jgi:hypothetical protein
LSRPHFPSIGHLCLSRVSSHRSHSFLRLQLQLDENTGTLQFLSDANALLNIGRRSPRADIASAGWKCL